MAKFIVFGLQQLYVSAVIEADNEREAREVAENDDGEVEWVVTDRENKVLGVYTSEQE